MVKAIKSPFKLVLTVIVLRRESYPAFKQIAKGKHFYDWQWRLLDRIKGGGRE
jgi:hypothetical protein